MIEAAAILSALVQHWADLVVIILVKFIARRDRGRERHVKAYFHTRLEDDLQFHLVLNTDLIALPDAAEVIAEGARRQFRGAPQGKE